MKILVDLCSLLSFSVANSLCGVNAPRALERVLVSILMRQVLLPAGMAAGFISQEFQLPTRARRTLDPST